ncbi:hypothetical protein GCM10010294_42870 [Streptomyces griseoloalbus]|nr:hypothetical protein GCM10010294_42870 [Streptomyces griseoloalbus]
MTRPRNTTDDPVHLGVPLPSPDPAPGCADCQRLARERTAAREAGDWTRVTDCNVQIRRCVH